jgi:homocysteine S-methyltransferase
VPGVRVPPALVERMRQAEDKGTARAEGVAIARELVSTVRPFVNGVQIGTPGRDIASILGVLEGVR